MINSLLGIGKRHLNFKGKISKYMSKRSYSFYVFHFIWVVLFQYLLFNVCSGNIILLYALPALFAYGATLLCCEICNRVSFFALQSAAAHHTKKFSKLISGLQDN